MLDTEIDMLESDDTEQGLVMCPTRGTKLPLNKKGKRLCPYGAQTSRTSLLDETQLLETLICIVDGSTKWILVASPHKPPRYL